MLKIFVRENMSPIAKEKFVFMSENAGTFTEQQLIKKMAEYNTTLTEADALAAFNVMKKIVLEMVLLGYVVQTPFGLMFAVAGGSTNDILADFTPKNQNTNHDIRLRFRPSTDIIDNVRNKTVTERSTNAIKTRVNIDVVRNADGNESSPIHPGDSLFISGDYLKFDKNDVEQGVFLHDGKDEQRLNYYTQVSPGKIIARVENDLQSGTYSVILKNYPTKTSSAFVYKKKITLV